MTFLQNLTGLNETNLIIAWVLCVFMALIVSGEIKEMLSDSPPLSWAVVILSLIFAPVTAAFAVVAMMLWLAWCMLVSAGD